MAQDRMRLNVSYNHGDHSERKAKIAVVCLAVLLGVTAIVVCVNAIPEWLTSLIKMMG